MVDAEIGVLKAFVGMKNVISKLRKMRFFKNTVDKNLLFAYGVLDFLIFLFLESLKYGLNTLAGMFGPHCIHAKTLTYLRKEVIFK